MTSIEKCKVTKMSLKRCNNIQKSMNAGDLLLQMGNTILD